MSSESNKQRQEAAEAAAIRRRWITLGEVVAVLAVLISGLTLWNSYSERKDGAIQRAEENRKNAARSTTLTLTAEVENGGKWLSLKPLSEAQTIQSQTVEFPTQLKADVADTAGEPRIEAHWFDEELKKARASAGRPDDSRGDEQLPVAITTRFLADGHLREDRAIYDIGYSISGRLIAGHTVTLRGLSLRERVTPAQLQPNLDARWARIMPAATK